MVKIFDISLDVTSPITKFYSSSQFSSTYPDGIVNNGFILKRSASQEFSDIDDGTLNFFFIRLHILYTPHILIYLGMILVTLQEVEQY